MLPLKLSDGEADILEAIQRGLESLYRLDPAPQVTHFLLEKDTNNGPQEELLLIEDDDLFIGLALDRNAVACLHQARLGADNLHEFSLVVEGISHFLCVYHRAQNQQSTSALELELQAEVDKYVAGLLLASRRPGFAAESLSEGLFSGYRLVEGLSAEEEVRYHHASKLARRYVRHLEREFVHASKLPAMLRELRRFYRMAYAAKHGWIAGAA